MDPDPPLRAQGRRVCVLTGTLKRLGFALAIESARADREPEAERLVEQIEAVTACVTEAEAADLCELHAKLVVLRHRLVEQLSEAVQGEALTLALAASLVRDTERLAA